MLFGAIFAYLLYVFGVLGGIWVMVHLPEIIAAIFALILRLYRTIVWLIILIFCRIPNVLMEIAIAPLLIVMRALYFAVRYALPVTRALFRGQSLIAPVMKIDPDWEFRRQSASERAAWKKEKFYAEEELRFMAEQILGLGFIYSRANFLKAYKAAMIDAAGDPVLQDAVNEARVFLLEHGRFWDDKI